MAEPTWVFDSSKLDAQRLRLDILNLAARLHDTSCHEGDDSVRDTALKLLAFVNGEEASLST